MIDYKDLFLLPEMDLLVPLIFKINKYKFKLLLIIIISTLLLLLLIIFLMSTSEHKMDISNIYNINKDMNNTNKLPHMIPHQNCQY